MASRGAAVLNMIYKHCRELRFLGDLFRRIFASEVVLKTKPCVTSTIGTIIATRLALKRRARVKSVTKK
eukprot:3036404-Amphidinium_carterae.1